MEKLNVYKVRVNDSIKGSFVKPYEKILETEKELNIGETYYNNVNCEEITVLYKMEEEK